MTRRGGGPLLLGVDTGSPRLSVAVGGADEVVVQAVEGTDRSSADLLALIDRVLSTAGLRPAELGGLVALRGPGSFTGLRVGLATVLGLHQALGLPALGVPSLEVLAACGPGDASTVVAAVDALRGEWFAQPFRSLERPRALGEPRLLTISELRGSAPATVVAHGATGMEELRRAGIRTTEPPPLAAIAVRQMARFPVPWEPASLIEPLYLRPPAARPQAMNGGAPA